MERFFVDDFDGQWSVVLENEGGTQTVCFSTGEDEWFYPADLGGIPYVLNVYGTVGEKPEVDAYVLPDNWESLVTKNNGLDHLPSIHDIMKKIN